MIVNGKGSFFLLLFHDKDFIFCVPFIKTEAATYNAVNFV